VNAPFAALFEFEVFNYVGDVDVLAIDARLDQCLIQQMAGRSHKRPALLILLVAGLLADQHKASLFGTLAEDRLRGAAVEVAAPALVDRLSKGREGSVGWQILSGIPLEFSCHSIPFRPLSG
jgi:hypothetical protein